MNKTKKPRYTKKTYIEVADILHKALDVDSLDIHVFYAVANIFHSFIKLFKKDNPKFNVDEFHHHVFKEDIKDIKGGN